MEVYLIRHGQSTNNALDDDSARTFDPPLTRLGLQQAALLAKFVTSAPSRDPWTNPATGFSRPEDRQGLNLNYLYVSPMHRALQTAAPLADLLIVPPIVRLDVFENGGVYLEQEGVVIPYPGKTRKRVMTDFPKYLLDDAHTDNGWYDTTQGRESYAQCCGRAIKVAMELRERAQGEDRESRIGIITHGTFMDVLIKAFLGMVPTRGMYFVHYNTAISRIDVTERDRVYVRYLNRVDHLPSEMIS